jgi:hypothetical protein
VLDGAMNSTRTPGEPAIVPGIESIEEAQVQTNNFSSEFGRQRGRYQPADEIGDESIYGIREFHRNAALNAAIFCDE